MQTYQLVPMCLFHNSSLLSFSYIGKFKLAQTIATKIIYSVHLKTQTILTMKLSYSEFVHTN